MEPGEPLVLTPPPGPKSKQRERISAEKLSEKQREISISEFFTKNRHLLGFDNASRALLTSVKEAVDNSLDACEEAGILPDLVVRIEQLAENRFKMMVEDNGPGIVKAQIPKVFGKLLYGSKFHRLRQSRGQQGIGISAAGMYGQLTTGKPVMVTSKTGKGKPAHHYHITIDTKANKPLIPHEDEFEWPDKDHGTTVEIEMEATYKGGRRSVDEYIQQVALANPHMHLTYYRPHKPPVVYPRVTPELPPETKEIKPHPYGVELGALMRLLRDSTARSLSGFLQAEFSRVSGAVAAEICKNAELSADLGVRKVGQVEAERLFKGISATKIMAPPTNCLAPIGEPAMLEGLKALLVQRHLAADEPEEREEGEGPQIALFDTKSVSAAEEKVTAALGAVTTIVEEDEEEDETEQTAEVASTEADADADAGQDVSANTKIIDVFGKSTFVTAVTRGPRVYRGNPFQVEAALAYGGDMPPEDLATVYRFANRVPLLYQQGACAMTQAVVRANWKTYDVQQSRGALPNGPLLVLVHIASVWVPFTSEAKEAVAHYDEIITELKFALQECGRRLSRHIRRRRRAAEADKKARYIEKYIPHIGMALQEILSLTDSKRDVVVDRLTTLLERSRKM